MKQITIANNEFELIEDNGNCFDEELVKSKYTDYFDGYDYIIGDFAYNKLRLKGFCVKKSKKVLKFLDIVIQCI